MKIAIVKLSALGDIVQAMVVLQFIKKFNSEILIDWIVDESYKKLLFCNQDINNIYSVDLKNAKKNKSFFRVFKELWKLRKLSSYDLVIDMQGLIKSALITKLIPSKCSLGFDKFSSRENLASIFYNKTFYCSYETNVIERNIKIINFALGFKTEKKEILNKAPHLFSREPEFNMGLSKTKKNILLIPGASHKSKRYPSSKLAEMTKSFDEKFLVLWGDSEERDLANQMKKISPKIHICNKLSLGALINLISKVDLVIGPDTGPTHMAWALNVPSITLFGSTPGYRNTYQNPINRIIESKSNVNPVKINKNDFSIEEIDPTQIKKVFQDMFEK